MIALLRLLVVLLLAFATPALAQDAAKADEAKSDVVNLERMDLAATATGISVTMSIPEVQSSLRKARSLVFATQRLVLDVVRRFLEQSSSYRQPGSHCTRVKLRSTIPLRRPTARRAGRAGDP